MNLKIVFENAWIKSNNLQRIENKHVKVLHFFDRIIKIGNKLSVPSQSSS